MGKKRNCSGCRALGCWGPFTTFQCALGYPLLELETGVYDERMGVFVDVAPREDCPKPRTNIELSEIFLDRRGHE